jgi:hypothetical protein
MSRSREASSLEYNLQVAGRGGTQKLVPLRVFRVQPLGCFFRGNAS